MRLPNLNGRSWGAVFGQDEKNVHWAFGVGNNFEDVYVFWRMLFVIIIARCNWTFDWWMLKKRKWYGREMSFKEDTLIGCFESLFWIILLEVIASLIEEILYMHISLILFQLQLWCSLRHYHMWSDFFPCKQNIAANPFTAPFLFLCKSKAKTNGAHFRFHWNIFKTRAVVISQFAGRLPRKLPTNKMADLSRISISPMGRKRQK